MQKRVPIYLSIDLDYLDSGIAPGVTVPENSGTHTVGYDISSEEGLLKSTYCWLGSCGILSGLCLQS